MITLEAGKLYQVRHWERGWIIAEYVKEIAAHSYKYSNLNMLSMTASAEKTRHVPLSHQWKKVRGGEYNSTFTVDAKGMGVRPVTEETVAEIANLKAEIDRLGTEQRAKIKELRELCN